MERFAEWNIDLWFAVSAWLIRHRFMEMTENRAEVIAEENEYRLHYGKRPLRI